MKVLDGVRKVQKYFPNARMWQYPDRHHNEVLARQLHMVGECLVGSRNDLIKLMDSLDLGIQYLGGGQYIVMTS